MRLLICIEVPMLQPYSASWRNLQWTIHTQPSSPLYRKPSKDDSFLVSENTGDFYTWSFLGTCSRVLHSRHFRGVNKFIFPETLRCLPLWILGLLKSTALRGGGGDIFLDIRMAAIYEILSCTLPKILHVISPTLYFISTIESFPKTEVRS